MLSNGLKHLCSRIIASLSAVGLISIANSAEAASYDKYEKGKVYSNGDTIKWTVASAKKFTAQYGEKAGNCDFSLVSGVASSSYVAVSGMYGYTGQCTYTCEAGKFAQGENGFASSATSFTVSGVAGATISALSGCVYAKPASCATLDNATSEIKGDPNSGFYCQWNCSSGYSVGGGDSTTTSIQHNIATSTAVQTPNGQCLGRNYEVTFDCTTSGFISGTDYSSATSTAVFGASFTIDKKCTPISGFTFNGWMGN